MTTTRYGLLPRFTQPVDAMTPKERQLFVDRAAFIIAKLASIEHCHYVSTFRQHAAILATARPIPIDDHWRKRYEPGIDALLAAHVPKQHRRSIVGGAHAVDTTLRLIQSFYRLGDLNVVGGRAVRLSLDEVTGANSRACSRPVVRGDFHQHRLNTAAKWMLASQHRCLGTVLRAFPSRTRDNAADCCKCAMTRFRSAGISHEAK